MKNRLDKEIVRRGLATSRSQAENYIRLGKVLVNGRASAKSGLLVDEQAEISIEIEQVYVSRAGLKLASVADDFKVHFKDKTVLDIGSSTGGFTDYALRAGAKKVVAVDVGTNQLHPSLQGDERVELHEKTDIRDFQTDQPIDIVLADVSFISLRMILPHVAKNLMHRDTLILAMLKPQFEAGPGQVNKGVIKNDKVRRQILGEFELWAERYFVIRDKRDSQVAGAKGNVERFYMLRLRAR